MEENLSGEWFVSDTSYGPLVLAKLGVAEENSGKLVVQVRQAAKGLAEQGGLDLILIDGPPGIGCPVIASLGGIDLAVVVTEPTLSGLHDLLRVEALTKHFKVRMGVIVNKYDLNCEIADQIESACTDRGVSLLGRIPFSESVSRAIVEGIPPVSYRQDELSDSITAVWENIQGELK
jgi:MinD superfamily P-loop ATPase